MSPSLLGTEGPSLCNVSWSSMAPAVSADGVSHNGLGLKENNYMGLSDCSSVGTSTVSRMTEENKNNLNLKATELRLGLPGSQSPERDSVTLGVLDEKQLFPLVPSKTVGSGNKRGFSYTVDGFSELTSSILSEGNWMFNGASSDPGRNAPCVSRSI